MRKLLVLILIFTFFSCVTASKKNTIENYGTKNNDEKQIIALVAKFQEGYTTQNFDKILSVYSSDALIKTIVDNNDWIGKILPKDEHAKILEQQMSFYKKRDITLEIDPPKSINVNGDKGQMTCTYELFSGNPYKAYVEEGVLEFTFKKEKSEWLISKRYWEITATNGKHYNEWKKKQKK